VAGNAVAGNMMKLYMRENLMPQKGGICSKTLTSHSEQEWKSAGTSPALAPHPSRGRSTILDTLSPAVGSIISIGLPQLNSALHESSERSAIKAAMAVSNRHMLKIFELSLAITWTPVRLIF
jgi:hypothetical protein